MYLEEIERDFESLSIPKYKAKQVFKWLSKGVESFDEMTDLSIALRNSLKEKYYIASVQIEKKLKSKYDETTKYLFKLNDGELIESVLMKYKHGYSICVSTQIGCKMGCKFCATGLSGFSRDLTASEILSQIQKASADNDIRISNIVLMGMGEPLDNYENVLRFLNIATSVEGINIGMRHISLSTCGVVDKIYSLAEEKLQLTLSISLHAPNDDIRNKLMPINKRYNISELLLACRAYIAKNNRRVSIEYAMIDKVNDSEDCARQLAKLLKDMLCHVNLIPVNSIGTRKNKFEKSKKESIQKFIKVLKYNKIPVTVRRTLGSDISASCGQLKRKGEKYENIC
ncbi:MAG: 23S rRNA (adenine(2503)-C(2))-methyltransferase RlmN [Clostridia bacterium]|nr:23S rRNA (adenine(2503)-C(2))-methyltransferase RlmN [Clostridia bacterium]